jgi:hydroxypyruvate reductase
MEVAGLRSGARAILRAAIHAADPTEAVKNTLASRRDLDKYERIFVVGAGKASGTMARAAENLLGGRIAAGYVNVKAGDPARCRRIELNPSGHPVPDRRGLRGAKRIAELVSEAGAHDLVIFLISGGASALMPLPAWGISLAEKKAVTSQLLARGATIHEMNTVRKHLSAIKGGQLARMAAPAKVLSLILSDVVGDNLEVIGSGPTAPDPSTIAAAAAVLRKYRIEQRVSQVETPKPGDPLFAGVENVIIGSNQKSLDAAAKKARSLGYRPLILSSTIEGETCDVARMHAAIAHQVCTVGQPVRPPVCIISGGETTVTIHGKGRGGRNQEFVLAAAIDIAGLENVVALSAGTDGTDGPTTAAGAIADGLTVSRSKMDARAALARNDSHPFFAALHDLIVTGPTGTNVMDIRILLVR